MSLLEAYLTQRRRAEQRMWLGFIAANAACGAMIWLMLAV